MTCCRGASEALSLTQIAVYPDSIDCGGQAQSFGKGQSLLQSGLPASMASWSGHSVEFGTEASVLAASTPALGQSGRLASHSGGIGSAPAF